MRKRLRTRSRLVVEVGVDRVEIGVGDEVAGVEGEEDGVVMADGWLTRILGRSYLRYVFLELAYGAPLIHSQ
jgi:hypothetical protein